VELEEDYKINLKRPRESTSQKVSKPWDQSELMMFKQDQGSKAPSRDHPNNSFKSRIDYIRVEY